MMAYQPTLAEPTSTGGVITRDRESLSAAELENLRRGGLDEYPNEAWTVAGTNRDNAYATHGLFRYFGKFPPAIAQELIRTYSADGDLVRDPTSGSGTTAVEATLCGRSWIASDVNPLSLLLTRVKTRRVSLDLLESAQARITKRYEASTYSPKTYKLPGLRNPTHWFLPETMESLGRLRAAIEREPSESPVTEVLRLAFAAVVRRASRATTQQGRLFLDVDSAHKDALPLFIKHLTAGAPRIAALPNLPDVAHVEQHDLRHPFDLAAPSAPLVIVHPPYFNAYRYSSVNSLELAWLGHSQADVRPLEIREFFKVGREENVDRYVDDMAQVIRNAFAAVSPDGILALMIGDTILHGAHIPVTNMVLTKALSDAVHVEKVILRIPRFTEATWVASQRRLGGDVGIKLHDYIIIMRKLASEEEI